MILEHGLGAEEGMADGGIKLQGEDGDGNVIEHVPASEGPLDGSGAEACEYGGVVEDVDYVVDVDEAGGEWG